MTKIYCSELNREMRNEKRNESTINHNQLEKGCQDYTTSTQTFSRNEVAQTTHTH